MNFVTLAALGALFAGAATPALTQRARLEPDRIAASETARLQAIQSSPQFRVAAAKLEADWDRTIADLITLTEIEAPPFKEETRARAFMEMLKAHGLTDVQMDKVGNVFGYRKGTGGGPLIVVSAHLDTVFPPGTDVKVKVEPQRLSAPGIGDDTAGLSAILALVRSMDAARISTKSDIVFMGNVGEEGQGDLRGMRYLFGDGPLARQIKYFISLEPGSDRITNGGVGSRRYEVTFKGPGGHSRNAFGIVNPSYALGNFLVEFAKTEVPTTAGTVFNVGVVEGGTSVNSIPFSMAAHIDMRSEGKAELKIVEDRFLRLVDEAVSKENADRSTSAGHITHQIKLIGDRPVGSTDPDSSIVQIAGASMLAAGVTPRFTFGSTDSNIPMSLGIEAITLGSGFSHARGHSLDEYIDLKPAETLKHMKINLAFLLALSEARLR